MSILRAVLGWSNNETYGGADLRLYALDEGDSPRWARDGGRTVERAIISRDGKAESEGDRYLIVRLGDRHTPDVFVEAMEHMVEAYSNVLRNRLDAEEKKPNDGKTL